MCLKRAKDANAGRTLHDHLRANVKTDLHAASLQVDVLAGSQSVSIGQTQLVIGPAHAGKAANSGNAASTLDAPT